MLFWFRRVVRGAIPKLCSFYGFLAKEPLFLKRASSYSTKEKRLLMYYPGPGLDYFYDNNSKYLWWQAFFKTFTFRYDPKRFSSTEHLRCKTIFNMIWSRSYLIRLRSRWLKIKRWQIIMNGWSWNHFFMFKLSRFFTSIFPWSNHPRSILINKIIRSLTFRKKYWTMMFCFLSNQILSLFKFDHFFLRLMFFLWISYFIVLFCVFLDHFLNESSWTFTFEDRYRSCYMF